MSHRTRAQSVLYNKLIPKHKVWPPSHGKWIEGLSYPLASSDLRRCYLLVSVQFTSLDPINSRSWTCWHRPRASKHQCAITCHTDGSQIIRTQNCVHWAFIIWLSRHIRYSLEQDHQVDLQRPRCSHLRKSCLQRQLCAKGENWSFSDLHYPQRCWLLKVHSRFWGKGEGNQRIR